MSSLQKQTIVSLFITILFYSAGVTCKHRICHECILDHVEQIPLTAFDYAGTPPNPARGCDRFPDASCVPEDSCADSQCSCICHISVALFDSHMYSPDLSKFIECEDLFFNPVSDFANRLERPPSMHA